MALTLTNLIDEWTRATGSSESSAGVSPVDGINQALTHLCSMHQWNGMVRTQTDLATVQGQDYIQLPDDLQEVISIQFPSSYLMAIRFVSPADLAIARTVNQHPAHYSSTFFGAMSWRVGPTGSVPVVDVYPKLPSTASDTFRLTYRSRLVLTGTGDDADTVFIPIPPYLEALARRLVRLFAKGIEEEDDGPLELRLEALLQSTWVRSAKLADGYLMPALGPLANGAASASVADDSWTDISLADPS